MNARFIEFRQELQKVIQVHFARALTFPRFATCNFLENIPHGLVLLVVIVTVVHCSRLSSTVILQSLHCLAILFEEFNDGFGVENGSKRLVFAIK